MFKLLARALAPPLALGVLCTAACTGPPPARPKLVVLGFDVYIDGKPLF